MIPKSGYRFSVKIMLKLNNLDITLEHDLFRKSVSAPIKSGAGFSGSSSIPRQFHIRSRAPHTDSAQPHKDRVG
jgi:hypothetical protein